MGTRQPRDLDATKQLVNKFEVAFLKARSGGDTDGMDKALAEVLNLIWAYLDAKGSAKELEFKAMEALLENAPTMRQIVRDTIRNVGPTELARFRSSPQPSDARRLRVYYPPPPARTIRK
jgi:hypothetical protein